MDRPENAKHLGGHLLKLYFLRVSDFRFFLLRPSNGVLLVKVLQVGVIYKTMNSNILMVVGDTLCAVGVPCTKPLTFQYLGRAPLS